MKPLSINPGILLPLLPLFFAGCKPGVIVEPEGPCTHGIEVFAYRGTHTGQGSSYHCIFGQINTTTGDIAARSSLDSKVYSSQGADHRGENNYYAFIGQDTMRRLLRISMGSGVSTLTNASYGSHFDGLVFNRNKLYCFNGNKICEIVVSGNSYTTNDVASTINPEWNGNSTTDVNTGAIYYQTSAPASATYNIEKWRPGGSPSTICSGMAVELLGIRHNQNDNMLYAIRSASPGHCEFVRIDSTGAITMLSSLPLIDPDFYSACLDPCSRRYLLSYKSINTSTGHLLQVDMSGKITQHDSAATMYQGMVVRY